MTDKPAKTDEPAMPFNEALKRVWAAPPAPKVKGKPAEKKARRSGLNGVTPRT